MQGKLIFAILLSITSSASIAGTGESPRRQSCQRVEQPQQRQPQAQSQQQRRNRPQGCPVVRSIPAVVDPTPFFLL